MSKTPNDAKDTTGQDKVLTAWLKTMTPTPPDVKEKKKMAAAIEFDLTHLRVYRGETVEQRLATFEYLGYLYEGMAFTLPNGEIYECKT